MFTHKPRTAMRLAERQPDQAPAVVLDWALVAVPVDETASTASDSGLDSSANASVTAMDSLIGYSGAQSPWLNTLAFPAMPDFNGDGKADILMQYRGLKSPDYTQGQSYFWLANVTN